MQSSCRLFSSLAFLTQEESTMKLRLKLPLEGEERERTFLLGPDQTVGKLLEDIQEEDEDISSTSLLSGSDEGQEVDLNALVSEVKDQDLSLVVNGEAFKVKTSVVERKEKMSFTVKDLEKQATFYTIVRQLRESPGTKMSLGDYLSTTKSLYGLSGEESRSLLTEMTKLGLVMHLPSDPEDESDVVITKPEEVFAASYGRAGRESPLQAYLRLQRDAVLSMEKTLTAQLSPYERTIDEHEASAKFATSAKIWSFTGATAGGIGLYWYLCYDLFSWDIMEPVTYFTGLGVSIISFGWWMMTDKDFEYDGMYDFFFQKSLKKRLEKANFDFDTYNDLREQREALVSKRVGLELEKKALDVLGMSPEDIELNLREEDEEEV